MRGRAVLAWLGLALATLALIWPLGLTNRILAGVDAFTYFAPYWDYRMAALRAGQIPLWNPYLFLGVPFLANPQAAVLYPLHWPLSWLTAEQALIWSAALHVWLAAGFTYTLARRSFGLSWTAAWLSGLLFGLGGFSLARIENINQLNALAWLPAMLWLLDETARPQHWRGRVRWGSASAGVIALCLLAGHTQSFFVNMAGLALYAAWPGMMAAGQIGRRWWRRQRGDHSSPSLIARNDVRTRLASLLTLLPALLLAAAQLLPTLELNGLGLRTGGLPYRQAVSFSLRPRLLVQSLLPPFGGDLAQAFASEGYAEFVGYIGVVGVILAAVGLRRSWKPETGTWNLVAHPLPAQGGAPGGRSTPLALAATGLFLALGAYNPVYYLLWRFVPGFDLFRAPVRWLALFALGAAVLAGIGLDDVARRSGRASLIESRHFGKLPRSLLGQLGLGLLALTGIALLAIQQSPGWTTVAGWAVVAVTTVGLLWAGRRWPKGARAGLLALTLAELWLAGRSLPFAQATAPLATSLRNAPATLLAATADQPAAGRDRFLSLSDIRFDPGDLSELRALQADRLPAEAVARLVRAAKQVEVIAPNLPLRFRLPAVDGYDGGLLPLGRYVQLQGLFLPPDLLVPDGRLREQLQEIPADRLLDLTGIRYVITDKQRDLWADDVYYDLQQPATLDPGQTLTLALAAYPAFSATAIGLVAEQVGTAPADASLGGLTVVDLTGQTVELALRPGNEIAITSAGAATPTILRLPRPTTPALLRVRNTGSQTWALHGLSLIDERTAAHTSITISPRGDTRRIHSGDVKIYERTQAPGRAWLVHGIRPVADDAAALAALADPAFDPRAEAILPAPAPQQPAAAAGADETVAVAAYTAEQVVLHAAVSTPAVLILADTYYPGWEATVNGQPAPIQRANLMFRGVTLTPGRHEVVFTYRPANWRRGLAISLGTGGLLLLALAGSLWAPGALRRSRRSGV